MIFAYRSSSNKENTLQHTFFLLFHTAEEHVNLFLLSRHENTVDI